MIEQANKPPGANSRHARHGWSGSLEVAAVAQAERSAKSAMIILRCDTLALFAALLIMVGCSHAIQFESGARPTGTHLTEVEAIRIADQAAERDGRHLSEYKPPKVRYYMQDKIWSVFFDGEVSTVGNHFWVTIDDQTGATQMHRGR